MAATAAGANTTGGGGGDRQRVAREVRVLAMLALIVVCFLLCNIPVSLSVVG
jgi:hypothetical protein